MAISLGVLVKRKDARDTIQEKRVNWLISGGKEWEAIPEGSILSIKPAVTATKCTATAQQREYTFLVAFPKSHYELGLCTLTNHRDLFEMQVTLTFGRENLQVVYFKGLAYIYDSVDAFRKKYKAKKASVRSVAPQQFLIFTHVQRLATIADLAMPIAD